MGDLPRRKKSVVLAVLQSESNERFAGDSGGGWVLFDLFPLPMSASDEEISIGEPAAVPSSVSATPPVTAASVRTFRH